MTKKEDQIRRLNLFFNGQVMEHKKDNILAGFPLIIGSPDGEWVLTDAEIEEILHQYHPEFSVTAHEARLVIFHQKEKEK